VADPGAIASAALEAGVSIAVSVVRTALLMWTQEAELVLLRAYGAARLDREACETPLPRSQFSQAEPEASGISLVRRAAKTDPPLVWISATGDA